MTDIASASTKIQIEATQNRSAVSELLSQTMGGSINYALDKIAALLTNISNIGANSVVALETYGTASLNGTGSLATSLGSSEFMIGVVDQNSSIQSSSGFFAQGTGKVFITGFGSSFTTTGLTNGTAYKYIKLQTKNIAT